LSDDRAPKARLAAVLGISRSRLYYDPKLPPKDWALKCRMETVLREFPSYGYRRLALELQVNGKRTLRVMRLFGMKPYRRRGRKPKKAEGSATQGYPNLLLAIQPKQPGQVWVSDFTYLWYKTTFVYLCTVMDIYTREVVGWSVQKTHDGSLVLNALFAGLANHARPAIFHSDNGREYIARPCTSALTDLGVAISRSAKGCPWENGYQESFYSQFKVDLGDPGRFRTLGELTAAIHQTVYTYNTARIHSILKMAPQAFARHLMHSELLS